MFTQEMISAIFLIAVLFLVLPSFLSTNNRLKQFMKNIYLGCNCCYYCCNYKSYLMRKIRIAITGCLGRMGQQLIRSTKQNRDFKLTALTESKKVLKNYLEYN